MSVWTTNIRKCLLLAIFLLPVTGGCLRFSSYAKKMKVKDKWFVDPKNRVRLFHGFNSVAKQPPWYDDQMLNETRLDLYKEWGFNVVRLGVMWAGVEPEEGNINETYITILMDIVKKLEKRNMFVILDMHQDVLSSKFGAYDGVPSWLVDKLPKPSHPYPWPLKRIQQWADGYLTQAVGRAFQDMYLNIAGASASMGAFWAIIASKFKDNDNVLGYELINEPWAGDIYTNPNLLFPDQVAQINLQPLYNRLNDAIRQVDSQTIIFYEPVTWGVYLTGVETGTGFTAVPGGAAFTDRAALSYHHYCWFYSPANQHKHYASFTRSMCDKVIGAKVIPNILNSIRITGGGSFMTEFGLCEPDGKKGSKGTEECEFILNQNDLHLQSWTYWDSKFFDKSGNVRKEVVAPFSRAFARSVAGEPMRMSFDLSSQNFTVIYILDHNVDAPTEIVVPRMHYPRGVTVQLPDIMGFTYKHEQGIVQIQPKKPAVGPFIVEVTISPVK